MTYSPADYLRARTYALALTAVTPGLVLYLTAKIRGQLVGWLLLLQGVFYVGYVAFVLSHI